MRSFGVPLEAAAGLQRGDRSRLHRRIWSRIKRALARILAPQHAPPAAVHATAVLRDGAAVHLRAIRPDDEERLRIAFGRLSPRSVYRRFFHPVTALTPDVLRQLTELDFRDRV